jgi:ABC-2 type transport system permease protein
MSLSGWGDLGFGIVALIIAALTAGPWFLPLAVVLVLLSAAVFVAFGVLVNSLAFFIGNAEAAAMQAREAVTNFSLYPAPIFRGWVRLMLLTALPAGFMGHVPVQILRDFDAGWLGLLALCACLIWLAALATFKAGLRRYESGNLIVLRG